MIASGKNAWKREERLRLWFEVVFDTTVEPPEHCAYLCKCCWEQFLANTDFVRLMAHAGAHEAKHESPYSQPRPSPITGEQVCELYGAILE